MTLSITLPQKLPWVVSFDREIKDFYHFEGPIARPGNFTQCIRVRHLSSGDLCACKIISKNDALKRGVVSSDVLNEVNVMRKLKHPNVVELLDVFENSDFVYVVMELCKGGEVLGHLQKNGAYTEARASRALRHVLNAIVYMHREGVLHGDIKPENLLLDSPDVNAKVQVIDFGCAKTIKSRYYYHAFLGTPYYVAPEVIAGRYNEACDVWSVGVVMFVMLYGHPPFFGTEHFGDDKEVAASVFEKITEGFDPVVKPGRGAWFAAETPISASAQDLLSKLLEQDPLRRPSAQEAFEHPWLRGQTCAHSPCDETVLTSLRSFGIYSHLQTSILLSMLDLLSPAEVRALEKMFAIIDKNNDGYVSVDELSEALMAVSLVVPDSPCASAGVPVLEKLMDLKPLNPEEFSAEVRRIVAGAGLSQEGISYQELLLSVVNAKLQAKEERTWDAFNKLDVDGDGRITLDELRALCKGGPASDEQIRAAVEGLVDADGTLGYESFLKVLRTQVTSHKQLKRAHKKRVLAASGGSLEWLRTNPRASLSPKSWCATNPVPSPRKPAAGSPSSRSSRIAARSTSPPIRHGGVPPPPRDMKFAPPPTSTPSPSASSSQRAPPPPSRSGPPPPRPAPPPKSPSQGPVSPKSSGRSPRPGRKKRRGSPKPPRTSVNAGSDPKEDETDEDLAELVMTDVVSPMRSLQLTEDLKSRPPTPLTSRAKQNSSPFASLRVDTNEETSPILAPVAV